MLCDTKEEVPTKTLPSAMIVFTAKHQHDNPHGFRYLSCSTLFRWGDKR